MNAELIKQKLKLFFIPFLITTVTYCILYTFLNWLLIIKLQLFSVKEVIVNFGIPFLFPWIIILWYWRSRLKTLNLTNNRGSQHFSYMIALWLAFSIPTIIAQEYLKKATGKLTALNNISEIDTKELSQYYTVKECYIDKLNIGVHSAFEVTGKHNENFNMDLFVTMPVFSSQTDTLHCLAWIGIKYSEQISNKLEDKEKGEKYKAFTQKSQEEFDAKDVSQFIYLDKIGNSDEGDGFKEAIKQGSKYTTSSAPLFLAVNEPFEKRFGNTLTWLFVVLGIGAVIWLIMILIPKFDEAELVRFERGLTSEDDELKEALAYFKFKEGYSVTPLLMYSNFAIYLVMFFSGLGFISFKSEDLLHWGANYRPNTMQGEWWRLLTSTFLHGGIMHLLANMYGLVFIGVILEPVLGKTKYLFVYLITGVLASCASLWWYDATVSVGASGAIFGLYGIFLALLVTKFFEPELAKPFLISTSVFIAFNLLMGFTGGIDNAAHIGGLISGFCIGLILRVTLKTNTI
jgi:rhomboid protease GluP